jgi:hypothetical protein
MKIKELIEQLQKVDPEMEAVILSDIDSTLYDTISGITIVKKYLIETDQTLSDGRILTSKQFCDNSIQPVGTKEVSNTMTQSFKGREKILVLYA